VKKAYATGASNVLVEDLREDVGQTKVGAIDLNKPRMRRVADAVLALASSPQGWRRRSGP
jgi:hypothetical protein